MLVGHRGDHREHRHDRTGDHPRSTLVRGRLHGLGCVDVDINGPFRCGSPTWTNRSGTHRHADPSIRMFIRKSDGRIRPLTGSLSGRRRLGRDGRRVTDQRTEPPRAAGTFNRSSAHTFPCCSGWRSLCRSRDDAEDLVQDTHPGVQRAQPPSTVSTRAWLLTIMRNANINRHRRQRPGLLRDVTDFAGEADRRNPPAPSAEDVATLTHSTMDRRRARTSVHPALARSNSSTSTASPTTGPPPRSASRSAP